MRLYACFPDRSAALDPYLWISRLFLTSILAAALGASIGGFALAQAGPRAVGARALTLPYPVVETESFSFRVGWKLPQGLRSGSLHVEIKNDQSIPVDYHITIVPPGELTAHFTAPAPMSTQTAQIVTWLGTGWRTPLAPIWSSPQMWVESIQDAAQPTARRAVWIDTLQYDRITGHVPPQRLL